MTGLLILGEGAEDAEDDLGRMVLQMTGSGTVTTGLDLVAAETSCLEGGPADLLAWALHELSPAVVVVVGDEDVPEVGTAEVVSAERAVVLAALRALVDGTDPAGASAQSVVTRLRDAQALLPVRRLVRERVPRVSVLVPVHDHAPFLDATVSSVLEQDYDDFEVVLMDDGSTDASLQVLRRYEGDPRVRVLTQANIGRTGRIDLPCNRLIRAARGELVAWLGGDDVALPHRLSAQVEVFDEDPALDVCHGAAEAVDAVGTPLGLTWGLERAYDDLSALRDLVATNLVGCPSAMVRASAYADVGPWEQGLTCDYHFWLKAAGRLRFRYLPRRLVQYRQHQRSLSTSAVGFSRTDREARRVRALMLQRRSLADLFPELTGTTDPETWYEAGVSLGNALVGVDPDAALLAYGLAAEARPFGHAVDHNTAVAHALRGDLEAAVRSARSATLRAPSSGPLLRALLEGRLDPESSLCAPDTRLSVALAHGRRSAGPAVRRWDGTALDVQRAVVGVQPGGSDLLRLALADWIGVTRDGDPLRWTIPSLGAGLDRLLTTVADAAQGLPLDGAADLVIEAIDDLALLPVEHNRPTGVLSTAQDVALLRSWAERARSERSIAA